MAQMTLTITVTDDGRVQVDGAIGNPVVAYGLLEVAKDAIRENNQKERSQIKPATPSDIIQLHKVTQ